MTPAPDSVCYAGFWRRKVAYGLDATIVLILYTLVSWLVGSAAHAQGAADIQMLKDMGWIAPDTDTNAILAQMQTQAAGAVMPSMSRIVFEIGLSIVVSAFYNIWFVAGGWQATPGKHWLGMKVVTADGAALTLGQSAKRHVASGISMLSLGLGFFMAGFTREKTALHDMICGTRVVRVKA